MKTLMKYEGYRDMSVAMTDIACGFISNGHIHFTLQEVTTILQARSLELCGSQKIVANVRSDSGLILYISQFPKEFLKDAELWKDILSRTEVFTAKLKSIAPKGPGELMEHDAGIAVMRIMNEDFEGFVKRFL